MGLGFATLPFAGTLAAFTLDDPAVFAQVFAEATVRAARLLDDHTRDLRVAIIERMTARVRSIFVDGSGHWKVPFPARTVTARRVAG
ncbi:MAG: hypothetical protein AAGC92_07645 [Pseudomonadota bacterium]